MKREYQRHLPHIIPEDTPIFVTWNLKGSLPSSVHESLQREREALERQPLKPGESEATRRIRLKKLAFARWDDALASATGGPLHLRDPDAARVVEDSLIFGVAERYELFAWCVMANHVHALLKPLWTMARIMQGIKGYTAFRINELQNARGRVFWQDESYDHWVRDDEELMRIIEYIENNPVAAGLCRSPAEWPWSSARFRPAWMAGLPYQALSG